MPAMYDLTGKRFGRLTVICRVGSKHKEVLWRCICDCGKKTDVTSSNLRYGHTKSCGCLRSDVPSAISKKHGLYGTHIYRTYYNMKNRCYNPNYYLFKSYGGKGITVCDEWLGENGLSEFYKWSMNNGYDESLSIDRIDNSKGYSPENCRWATMKEQQNNRTNNHLITINGVCRTLKQWSEKTGIPYNRLMSISIRKGDSAVCEVISHESI